MALTDLGRLPAHYIHGLF